MVGNRAAFYLGVAALSLAWLGVWLAVARPPTLNQLWLIGAAWSLPLLAGPVLFSHDVYSYLAQGELLHLGLNPYHNPPAVLSEVGHPHLLAAVSPFWRHTTAPYGPLFLAVVSLIAGATASHLVAGVLLVRLLDLVGVVLVAVFAPRLARALGADPRRATWLAVLSPLVLLELVAAVHNDALMVGLMLAGVALAAERHPVAGILLCAVAATIKLPAAIAVVFIVVAWARESPNRLRVLSQSALAAAAALVAISLVSGAGFSWISPSLVSTPQKVRLAITPATGVGWTIAAVSHDLGVAVSSRRLESAVGVVSLALLVAVGVALVWRTRAPTMTRDLGLILIAAALGGPAAWPWYLTWGIALLAAVPGWQRSPVLPAAAIVSVFLVKASGILALPLPTAPAVVGVYAVLAALAAYAWRWRRRGEGRSVDSPAATTAIGDPRSPLVESP